MRRLELGVAELHDATAAVEQPGDEQQPPDE